MLVRAVGDQQTASTRYRVFAHLENLRASGFIPTVETEKKGWPGPLRAISRLRALIRDGQGGVPADLIFVHRRTYPPFFARRLRRPGVPIVFDFDDALFLPPPGAPQDERATRRFGRNFYATVAQANVVICGNQVLAREVQHPSVEILPTPVDCDVFQMSAVAAPNEPVVGWVGHGDNLPFLEALADPLRELSRRHSGFRLVVVADRPPSIEGLEVEFRKWTIEEEVSCFDGIGVGLMPLDDTPWTRAKCAFKALQYMALGIPTVASPVGMNREVVTDGVNGYLATSPESWFRAIDTILGDRERARNLAIAARQTVEAEYSLSVISDRLVSILLDARRSPA